MENEENIYSAESDTDELSSSIETSEVVAESIEPSKVDLNYFDEASKSSFAPVKAFERQGLSSRDLIEGDYYNKKSVSKYFGERFAASIPIHSTLGKSRINERYQTVTKPLMPSGLVPRPTDKDYIRFTNKLLDKPDSSMRGVYFQMQEESVVSNLLTARGSVDLLMDGVGVNSQTSSIGITGANEIVKETFKYVNDKKPSDIGEKKAETMPMDVGLLHPKMAYFTDSNNKITGFIFGTQNITAALPKNNTVEEALFISGAAANSHIGQQIKVAVDVMHQLSGGIREAAEEDKASLMKSFRDDVRTQINSVIVGHRSKAVYVNEDIHTKLRRRLGAAVAGKEKVVLNIQYLENIFKPSNSTGPDKFTRHRGFLLGKMKALAEADSLSIVMSATSVDKDQGLFNLISQMGKVDKSSLTGVDLVAYGVFELLKEKGVFKLQPVQYMHSKSAAFLERDDDEGNYTVKDVFITTANYGRNSLERNIEVGLFLTREDRDILGIGTGTKEEKVLNEYFTEELESRLNKGLFMEASGKSDQVLKTIGLLEAVGGREVYSRESAEKHKGARFTYQKRYRTVTTTVDGKASTSYELVGLNIILKDRHTFSVTVGSTTRYTQDKATGAMVSQEAPIIYLNKGNRVITGAAYKYTGKKPITIEGFDYGKDVTLTPGSSLRIDANQFLVSLIETFEKSYFFEREKRSLLLALNYLAKKHGLEEAIQYWGLDDKAKKGLNQQQIEQQTLSGQARLLKALNRIVLDQNLEHVGQNANQIRTLLSWVPDADAFYQRTVKESKKNINKQVFDPLSQAHELPYSAQQLLENLPLFGSDEANMLLLYDDYEDSSFGKVQGLILSQTSLRHEDSLSLEGRPAIRGVAAISRPQSLSELEMLGGLHKARESAPKVLNANILNSIQGLRAVTAHEYRKEFDLYFRDSKDAIADSEKKRLSEKPGADTEYINNLNTDQLYTRVKERYVSEVFRLYQERDLTKEEREDAQSVSDNAVIYFFPYPKTEQVSQRLKNLLSVRPLSYGSKAFREYVTSFGGTQSYNNLAPEGSTAGLVRSSILSGLPSAQFNKFVDMLGTNYDNLSDEKKAERYKSVVDKLRESSLNVDDPDQGFIGEEQRFLMSMANSAQSDYSYINAEINRTRGFIFGHRTQTPINFDQLQMSQSQFINRIEKKLKPGTLFVAKDVHLSKSGQDVLSVKEDTLTGSERFFKFILEQLGGPNALKGLKAKDINQKLSVIEETKDWAKFIKVVNNSAGGVDYYLKAGVYVAENTFSDGYDLHRIGRVKEGGSTFIIEGLESSKRAAVSDKLQDFTMRAPAMPRREEDAIAVMTDISIGEVDGQPGMATLNVQFITEMSIVGGLRGSNVKGPMSMMESGFMSTVDEMFRSSSGEDIRFKPEGGERIQQFSQTDLFGIIGSGQIKGFIFNAGNVMLRKKRKSDVYKLLEKEGSGKKVAEALALTLLEDKDVRGALQTYYSGENNRQQIAAVLSLIDTGSAIEKETAAARDGVKREKWQGDVYEGVKSTVKRKDSKTISGAYQSTISIYSGLISLIAPDLVGLGAEEGLKETIKRALTDDDEAEQLQKRAQKLLDTTFEDSTKSRTVIVEKDGQYVEESIANETTSRSTALLAFFLKASNDLLYDIDPNDRFYDADKNTRAAITEFGYIDYEKTLDNNGYDTVKTIVEKTLSSFLQANLVYVNEEDASGKKTQKRATQASDITAFNDYFGKDNNNTLGYANFKEFRRALFNAGIFKTITGTDGIEHRAPLFMSTKESFMVDKDVQHRYLAAAQAQGITLNKPDIFKLENNTLETYIYNEAFGQDETDLALYAIYASGQANRYMEIMVDPTPGRIMPAVGMQDQTELEGHYASKLSQLQLNMYTSSIKDINAYASVQQTVLTLGAIVEENYGYQGSGRIRSMYRLNRVNLLELGLDSKNYRTTLDSSYGEDEATANQNRLAAAKLSMLFSNSYSKTMEKGLPRLLKSGGADDDDDAKSIISTAPTDDLVSAFYKAYSSTGDEDKTSLIEAQIEYMKHLKQVTSELTAGLENDVRIDYLVDNYITKLGSESSVNPIKVQAEQLVSDLIALKRMHDDVSVIADNTKIREVKEQLKQKIAELDGETDADKRKAIKENLIEILTSTEQYERIEGKLEIKRAGSNKNENLVELVRSISNYDTVEKQFSELEKLTTKAERQVFISNKTAEERKALLRFALAKEYDKFNKKSTSAGSATRVAKAIKDRETAGNILTVIARKAEEANAADGSVSISSAPVDTNHEIMFELVHNIIGKNFEDKIRSSVALDPGKEYLGGRQRLRELAKSKQLTTKGKEQDFFKQVESQVGLTQTIEIPMLDTVGRKAEDGLYTIGVKNPVNEIGIILGLDILERVALIFPEFSSEAINAQYAFIDALTTATEEGILSKISTGIREGEDIRLSAAEIEVYNKLRSAATMTNRTAVDLINNQKTMRNAMGEQLNMVGASYIGVSSFLVNANEIAAGSRFDNLLDVGNAGLKTLLRTLYSRTISTSSEEATIAAKEILYIESALSNMDVPDTSDALETVQSRLRHVRGEHGEDKLMNMFRQRNTNLSEDFKALERQLYATNILTGRQGAPAGTGAAYAEGRIRTTLETLSFRADDVYSDFKLDVYGNKTALILSTLGTQFTELGDYDGDSFQAAITRMAETAAEIVKSWEELDTIKSQQKDLLDKVPIKDLTGDTLNKANELNEVIDTITHNLNEKKAMALERAKALAQNIADKVQAMAELHRQSKEIGLKKIRKYAEQFLGLPAEVFNDGGAGWAINAIEDNEINTLIKQTRDTISGFYDNRSHNQGWLAGYLGGIAGITRANADSGFAYNIELKDEAQNKLTNEHLIRRDTERRRLLSAFIDLYEEQSSKNNNRWAPLLSGADDVVDITAAENQFRLVTFVSTLSQTMIGIKTLNKAVEKALGSNLTPSSLKEVQAIIGSTGTGLLGQTYNTIIPLLTMTAGDLAVSNVVSNKENYLRELFSKVSVARKRNNQDGQVLDILDILFPYIETNAESASPSLAEAAPLSPPSTLQLGLEKRQQQTDAALGMLLDIQQFLRDAALKPKEKGSVGEAASLFKLKDSQNYTWAAGKVGLVQLMEAAEESGKAGMVLQQFIKTNVGAQLNIDFGIEPAEGQVIAKDATVAQEMRAFSVLEMMNEYLSGKLTAAKMFTESVFSSLLSARRKQLRDSDDNKTDREIVQDTLIQSLTRFRAEFIYNSVLEGDKYGDILGKFGEKIMAGYDVEVANAEGKWQAQASSNRQIEQRTAAFKSSKLLAINETSSGKIISPEEIEYMANAARTGLSEEPAEVKRLRTLLSEQQDQLKETTEAAAQQLTSSFDNKIAELESNRASELQSLKVNKQDYIRQTKIILELQIEKRRKLVKQKSTLISQTDGRNAQQQKLDATTKINTELKEAQSAKLDSALYAPTNDVTYSLVNRPQPMTEAYLTAFVQREMATNVSGVDELSALSIIKDRLIDQGAIDETVLNNKLAEITKAWNADNYEITTIDGARKKNKSALIETLAKSRQRKSQTAKEAPVDYTYYKFAEQKATDLFNKSALTEALVYAINNHSNLSKEAIERKAQAERAVDARIARNEAQIAGIDEQISHQSSHITRTQNLLKELAQKKVLYSSKISDINKEISKAKKEKQAYMDSEEYKTELAKVVQTYNTIIDTTKAAIEREEAAAAQKAYTDKKVEVEYRNAAIRDTSAMTVSADIEEEVEAFRARQIRMQTAIIGSLNKLDQTQILDAGERGKAIFKGIIFHNIQETMQTLVSGDYNMLDKLIEVNRAMSSIKKDSGLLGIEIDDRKLEVLNIAFASLMGAGKLNASAITQTSTLLQSIADKLTKGAGAERKQSVTSLLMGAGLGIQAVEDQIQKKATELAGEDKALVQQHVKEMTNEYAEILTTSINVKDSKGERTTTIAEELIKEASRAAEAKDMQAEAQLYRQVAAQATIEGDAERATAATTIANNITNYSGADTQDLSYKLLTEMHHEINVQRDRTVVKNITEQQEKAKKTLQKEHSSGTLLSLLAIPALFAVAQGDVTFNDRVASMFTDVTQTLMTTTSFEDSPLRQALAGRDPDKNMSAATKRAEKAGNIMQRARISESIRRSYSQTEGLIKGVAFEAGMQAAGYFSSKLANRFFKGNLTAQVATEVVSGMASMAVASALTNRSVPGTYSDYDTQMALTMKIINNIRNNMLMVEGQAVMEAVSENYAIDPESGSLDSIAFMGDFEQPPENTAMSFIDRLKFYENTLESSEEIPIIEETNV